MKNQQRPALMLPMGKKDSEDGSRMAFLRSMKGKLDEVGWCIGVQAAGPDLRDWAYDCFQEIRDLGGRITYHLPDVFGGRGDKSQPPEEQLMSLVEQVQWYHDQGLLELATLHLKQVITQDPPADAGLERYNSPIDAQEMLEHIKWHVSFLRKLNEAMGGILSIENVPLTNFRQAGHRLPTYLTLRAGSWYDLIWLSRQAGVKITFDIEHFLAAGNLLARGGDLSALPRGETVFGQEDVAAITGYYLIQGKPPTIARWMHSWQFVQDARPALYHLGGSRRDTVIIGGKPMIDTHKPIDPQDDLHELDLMLRAIVDTGAIGAVVEVCGNLRPDLYDPCSPRVEDDDIAKMMSYLAVADRLRVLKGA